MIFTAQVIQTVPPHDKQKVGSRVGFRVTSLLFRVALACLPSWIHRPPRCQPHCCIWLGYSRRSARFPWSRVPVTPTPAETSPAETSPAETDRPKPTGRNRPAETDAGRNRRRPKPTGRNRPAEDDRPKSTGRNRPAETVVGRNRLVSLVCFRVSTKAFAFDEGVLHQAPLLAFKGGNRGGDACLLRSCLFKAHHRLEHLGKCAISYLSFTK